MNEKVIYRGALSQKSLKTPGLGHAKKRTPHSSPPPDARHKVDQRDVTKGRGVASDYGGASGIGRAASK